MKTQAKAKAKATATATATAKPIVNAISAQSGALTGAVTVTVQTRKASAKTLKAVEPLVSAMSAIGENTSPELLARLPQTTVAFKVFSGQVLGTAQLFAWFDDNRTNLTRKTKEGKLLLNMAGAYVSAFGISHDNKADGPLKAFPFYKRFSNALQQWARLNGGVEKRASGAITDAIQAYLDKKERDDAAALSDSIVAWVLKHETVRERILNSKAA